MKSVLFIDEYFVINFIMDWLVVWFVSKISNLVPDIKRQLAASFIGSLMACIYVLTPGGIMSRFFFHLITAFAMTFVLCGIKNRIETYIKILLLINICCIFTAGIMNYIFYTGIFTKIFMKVLNNPVGLFVISVAVTFMILNITAEKILQLKKSYKPEIYDVTLWFNENEIKLKALVDTGNTLTDPVSGRPVHIAAASKIEVLIKDVDIYSLKLKIIPFHSIGKDGILNAIVIDKMVVYDKDETTYLKPIVGLYQGKLSENEAYDMLLNRNGK